MERIETLDPVGEGEPGGTESGPRWAGGTPLRPELDEGLDDLDPAALEWVKIKRSVNRLSIRDLCAAIVPALHAQPGRVLIAVRGGQGELTIRATQRSTLGFSDFFQSILWSRNPCLTS